MHLVIDTGPWLIPLCSLVGGSLGWLAGKYVGIGAARVQHAVETKRKRAARRAPSTIGVRVLCGARFVRLADGAEVVCGLAPGHECAHAWEVEQ